MVSKQTATKQVTDVIVTAQTCKTKINTEVGIELSKAVYRILVEAVY